MIFVPFSVALSGSVGTRPSGGQQVASSHRLSRRLGPLGRWLVGCVCGLMLATAFGPAAVLAQDSDEPNGSNVAGGELREGVIVRIPLPITGETDSRVRATIERYLENLPVSASADERPVLILEFDTLRGAGGRGSQFERCMSLARYLTGPDLSRVQTVAFLPGPSEQGFEAQPLAGHALLVALACETWAVDSAASIGSASLDESNVDSLVLEAYRSIAARRQVLPPAVVESLVDRSRGLAQVDLTDGSQRYVSIAELERLEAAGESARAETLVGVNETTNFDAETLFRRRFADYLVKGRADLARQLKIRSDVISGDPSLGEGWTPVYVKLEGPIDRRRVDWVLGALDKRIASGTDLVVLEIDSSGGSFRDAARLAQRLLDLDPLEVRTVAYVPREARGGGALIALTCDQIMLGPEAVIGGPALPELQGDDLLMVDSLADRWIDRQEVAPDWVRALLDPSVQVSRYRHQITGEEIVRTARSQDRLDEAQRAQWKLIGPIDTAAGIDAKEALRNRLARHQVGAFEELSTLYDLPQELERLEPTQTFRWIDRFARFISSPLVSSLLLMLGMMFFFNEMGSPGLGLPGFLAATCFGLYFWAHYLGGTAHWLEIMMFAFGVVFILMEIFVIPGLGIFGFGGVVLIIVSIVLASQTFIVPTTQEDFARLPASLGMIVAMAVGGAIPIYLLPRYLHRIPFLKRLSLNPAVDQAFADVGQRESTVHLEYLRGKMGVAITSLKPGGKVRFGDEDVSAVTDGKLIDRGTKVVVKEVRGNRVLVDLADYQTD